MIYPTERAAGDFSCFARNDSSEGVKSFIFDSSEGVHLFLTHLNDSSEGVKSFIRAQQAIHMCDMTHLKASNHFFFSHDLFVRVA